MLKAPSARPLARASSSRAGSQQPAHDDAGTFGRRRGQGAVGYGSAKDAVGSARDAVASGVDAVASMDISELRDEIARLSQLVERCGAETDVLDARPDGRRGERGARQASAQSASAAQEKLTSVEGDVEDRIRTNPWVSVGIAVMVGFPRRQDELSSTEG